MNNLKRVLSLGLVGAMLSGMMIMGAGAATYSDVDEIDNIEAVETMGALNIINGTDKGTFDPDGFVTRGQMAKMIAVTMNGGKEPNFGAKTTASFTDIKGHWAETFIEYCTSLGIISGRGDGTFDPDGQVTGVEAAKMVLSALNYDAVAYQLTGPEWDNHVNTEATQTCSPSLYDTLENIVMSQPIDRDTAAQMIWNGLQNVVMVKQPDKTVSTGEVTFNYGPDKNGKTLLNVRYGALIGFGTLAGNSRTDTGLTDGHIKVDNFILDRVGATDKGTVNFPYDMDLSLIGEKVKIIFKDGNQGGKETPDKNDTIYGVFNANETEVVNDILANVKDYKKNGKYGIKIDGTEYELNPTKDNSGNVTGSDVKVYYNYVEQTFANSDLVCSGDNNSNLTLALKLSNGDTIKAVRNDGKITAIYVTKTQLQRVTAVSADKVTISEVGTIKKADNDVYDGIAKDDVVAVTTLYKTKATDDDAYSIVEKAEVVTGEISKYKNNDGDTATETITVDGTAYKVYNKTSLKNFGDGDFISVKATADDIGDEVELYLVNGYVGAVKKLTEDAKNYSVVIDNTAGTSVGNFFDAAKIRVMAADGTKTTLELDKDSKYANGDKVKTGDGNWTPSQTYQQRFDTELAKGAIVTYDLNKDGTATVRVRAYPTAGANAATYNKSTKSLTYPGSTGTVTDPNCVLFVQNSEGDFKAYTIRNLGDIATTTAWGVVTEDNKVVAAYLGADSISGAASSKVFGIVSSSNGTVKIDGTNYRQFEVNVNGEVYTVNQKNDTWSDADPAHKLAKGLIVGFEPTNDGIYEGATDFEVVSGNENTAFKDGTKAYSAWVKEYVADDGIITLYNNIAKRPVGTSGTYVYDTDTENVDVGINNIPTHTYAVDGDVKMYYVDTDGDTGLADGSVVTLNTMTGHKTVYLIVEEKVGLNGTRQPNVVAIIAEVGGEEPVTEH